jgi:6-phosphogluconate dehydrogenase
MKLAIIGLGVMGRNLALNFRGAGHEVVTWDPWPEARQWQADGALVCDNLDELVGSLPAPRIVLLMVKSGEPVRQLSEQLSTLLDKGDIIVDGGNSHFIDTQENAAFLTGKSIHFAGLGVSGGAEGARHGPSMMLGCDASPRDVLMPLLSSVAARNSGKPCISWFGEGGAGHFVKMVHNGIEYAIMQAIAEAWQLLEMTGMSTSEAGRQMVDWSKGDLAGYLMEISGEVLQTADPATGKPMISVVDDAAGQKGTGGWCIAEALNLGVPVPAIMAAVTARQISSQPALRTHDKVDARQSTGLTPGSIHGALTASIALALVQGAHLLRVANAEHGWSIDLAETARVWRQGSILRMAMLDHFADQTALSQIAGSNADALRKCVLAANEQGLPGLVMTSSLGYLDSCKATVQPTALVQLQRDRFGSHGLKNRQTSETFHGPWHGTDS